VTSSHSSSPARLCPPDDVSWISREELASRVSNNRHIPP
ncbi:BRCA1, partial [Caenorhabditis elegans]